MSRSQTAAPQHETPPTSKRPPRPPAVEAIAGWSARHRKTALFGWLALVAVAYLVGLPYLLPLEAIAAKRCASPNRFCNRWAFAALPRR